MTKTLKTLSCICLLLTTSCNTNKNFKRLEDNRVIYGKVKSITETLYSLKEKFGELQRDGEPSITHYWFDENTNLIKEQVSGSTWDSTVLKYDKENKLIEELYFDDGTEQAKAVYTYSDANTKRKESYSFGYIMHINVSKFDSHKNKTELNEYNDDGTPSTKHSYEYDNVGNKRKESVQQPNEGIKWTTYKFDGKNNRIEEQYESTKFTFKFDNFDKYGNWLKQTAISDAPFYLIERKIEYFE